MYASVRSWSGFVNSRSVSLYSISSPMYRNAVRSLTRAACCIECVTMTTEKFWRNSSISSSTWLVAIGSNFSALWILIANGWMQNPVGAEFNPITVWFGHDIEGSLRAVMYEVHNTFGHSHSNLAILPKTEAGEPVPRHEFDKVLHVSPFFDQIGRYRITLVPPGDDYSIVIEYLDDEGAKLLTASQDGRRVELTTRSLLKQFFTSPLLTLKVVGGIHWEALRFRVYGFLVD